MTGSEAGWRSASSVLSTSVRLHQYTAGTSDDVVVLLHGYPQTAWQWRHVVPLLVEAGYRVVAPDLRGAGHSSRPRRDEGAPADARAGDAPRGGYDKRSLAEDVHELLAVLGLTAPAFVVGHDIGAMVAVAYALRYRQDTRALSFGEAPVPGTQVYEEMKTAPTMWHIAFHSQLDLPEALTAGREEIYLQHFYDRLGLRPTAVDTEHYARSFAQAGAMRAGFDLYRAFEQDAADSRAALAEGGKLDMPVLAVHGEVSAFTDVTERMAKELADECRVEPVPDTGHWLAEENPEGLVQVLTDFDRRTRGS